MPRFQDRADLDCGASRQFQTQLAGFLEEFRMATNDAKIGTWWRPQTFQPTLAIGADPAIQRHPRVGPATAIGMFEGLVRQLAYQVAALGRREPRIDRVADDAKAE